MKVVLQDGIKDCGVCSLLSIIRFYGGDVSKEYLRELTNTTKDGVSLYNLIEAAKKIGFDAIGLNGNLNEINVNNLPCIVHYIVNKNYQHFAVLYKIDKKKKQVTLMDPAKGKKIISFSEFNLLSSNNYLFLTPNKKLPMIKKKNIIYRIIKETFKISKKDFLLIIILTSIYFFLNIIASLHFKLILEYSINYNISNNITIITIIMINIYLFKNLNLLIRDSLMNKYMTITDIETTTTTYKQLLLLPYLYYKNRTTGEVISRFKDLNRVRTYLPNLFCTISTDLFCLIIFGTLMFKYNSLLTFIIVGLLIIIILYTLILGKYKKKIIKKMNAYEDSINSYLVQGLSNVDTVKGSHLEKRIIDKFTLKYKSFQETIYQYSTYITLTDFFKNNVNDFIYLIVFSLGSYLVIIKKLSLSSLIVYQTFINYLMGSTYRIINILDQYQSYKASLDRVEELFMLKKENFKNNYFYLSYTLEGDIIYQNLSYKIGSKLLFNNLNLIIKKGEKILLSGSSGSGKSTLVKMLMRYIETEFNTIKISNIDINHYHLENIRANITYVTSNEYLFHDTLKNNITLYKEYSNEEIERVCNLCLIKDIIKDNNIGVNKLIEENGFNLSNGERQRIILARSIIKKNNIYIFDEALGQIDINKEAKILEKIFEYLKEKTVIVISHRFNNKKLFDRVLKLENGKIIEN